MRRSQEPHDQATSKLNTCSSSCNNRLSRHSIFTRAHHALLTLCLRPKAPNQQHEQQPSKLASQRRLIRANKIKRQVVKMCGIRSCLSLIQWMTGETATKYEPGSDETGPRPVVKGESGKWDLDLEKQAARAKAQREGYKS